MKKILTILAVTMLIFTQAACSNASIKAIEQGKLAMASSDYRTALNSLQFAKDEGVKNKEIDTLIAIIENYLNAKEAYDAGNADDALNALGKIPSGYAQYVIHDDIDKLKEMVNDKKLTMDDIDSQIAGTKKLIADGDYTSAITNINELYTKNLTAEQTNQVNELKDIISSAQQKINASEKVVYITQPPQPAANNRVIATYYVVKCNEFITLRNAPSTSAGEITKIPLGKTVGYIENAGNGFYKISYNNMIGYSLAEYLSPYKPSGEAVPNTRMAQVVNAQEFITLRSSPSTSASEITRIPAGSYVTYLGEAGNDFYRIMYNGMTGYGLRSYIRE